MYVILTYDIAVTENYSQRQNRTFKICKKYLTHVQKSTFEGVVTEATLRALQAELRDWINRDYDSVIVFINKNPSTAEKEFWGTDTSDDTSNFL